MVDAKSNLLLMDLMLQHRTSSWIFVRPGGNWGDHLIYAGAEALARRLNIHWIDLDWRSFETAILPSTPVIYLHGSGGFNSWGSGRAFEILKLALHTPDALVIQGPQTCDLVHGDGHQMLLRAIAGSTARELHIYAREWTSFMQLANALPDSAQLHLDHDTALQLEADDIFRLSQLPAAPEGRYTLLVVRRDNESASLTRPACRGVVEMDPAYYADSFAHWLRIHAHARRIVTNRLHSAIAGVLFDRPVTLLGGSYHKNHSVWEYSLQPRGVSWSDNLDILADGSRPLPLPRLPGWLQRSWKVQRLLMRLRGVPA